MASKRKDIQGIGITFGDWKLVPMDGENWELCHRHVTGDTESARRSGTVGEARWHRLGRYYQHSTFGGALEYAADVEAKRGCVDAERDIRDAIVEWRDTLEEFRTAFEQSIRAS